MMCAFGCGEVVAVRDAAIDTAPSVDASVDAAIDASPACTAASCDDNDACTTDVCQGTTCVHTSTAPPGSMTFAYSGADQSFAVPTCVSTVTIEAWGAEGGRGSPDATSGVPGMGGYIKSDHNLAAGTNLVVVVGGRGLQVLPDNKGGGGGGRSEVRISSPSSVVIVAGGGGGASGQQPLGMYLPGMAGGAGGYPAGGPGIGIGTVTPPGGGTQTAGGIKGNGDYNGATAGAVVTGGGGGQSGGPGGGGAGGFGGGGPGGYGYGGGGGGGGGYFGGGGGDGGNSNGAGAHAAAGGGGGSSFSSGTNIIHMSGMRSGDGQVKISW